MKNRLKGPEGLERLEKALGVDLSAQKPVLKTYKWATTPYYLDLARKRNLLEDPIGQQVIPSPFETKDTSRNSSPDPLQEQSYSPVPGLIHRYRDRVLILASSVCASYCRHCNRKRTWRSPEALSIGEKGLGRLTDYISKRPHIREVLISGGDPLLLPLNHLARLLGAIRAISTVKVIRIGSRVPVVLPMKITDRLCRLLKRFRPLWLNTHFNHPSEITRRAKAAIEKIQLSGIPVSNQTVLLKGINDRYETLHDLFCALQEIMVRPYYLFQCDHVKGTGHFRTDLHVGISIMERLWGDTGGMCIPRFVADLPGGNGKVRLIPSQLLEYENKVAVFRTFDNRLVKINMN